ncbi:hypothetical protein M3Y97_00101700 [Aphelenchoides bicaudatus]|nr:hypothetical protein M3Y97_00101700 [Aphelenchoides bicaudatus]
MAIYTLFILFLIYFNGCSAANVLKGDSTCLSSWRYIRSKYNQKEQCDIKMWQNGQRPDPFNSDFSYCTRKIITDLSSRFTMKREFVELINFIRDSMGACFHKTTGHNFIMASLNPGHVENYKEFSCCSIDTCKAELNGIDYNDYLKTYSSDDLVVEDPDFNFEYTSSWIDQIKKPNWTPCNYNSMLFITNRIIDIGAINNSAEIFDYFRTPSAGLCVEMTIILVAREEATQDMLYQYYSNITENLYVVPDLNCIHKLSGCILPCLNKPIETCKQEQLKSCKMPTDPPTTTTLLTTARPIEEKPDSAYVIYVFALSTDLSVKDLNEIRNSLVKPAEQFSTKFPVNVAFYLPSSSDSTYWISFDQIQSLSFNEGDLLQVNHPIDKTIKYPTDAIINAISRYKALNNSIHWKGFRMIDDQPAPKPILILLTDYVSDNFVQTYYTGLNGALKDFTFRIYSYDNYTYKYFYENSIVDHKDLFLNDAKKPTEISLDGDDDQGEVTETPITRPKITEIQLVMIVVGSVAVLLICLIIGTVIYKHSWFNKVKRFRNKHQESGSHSFITEDYFELSWDKLLIKSEKIGSGAYGQVFRGKFHGRPPCVDHIHSDRPHLAIMYENCDIAVKMLPKFASESARKEFLNEIHLMKTIGYNENIVNMLGCISVGQAICLVLEYCPNRDLHQYVKALKVDVNISKSIDVKVNFTKEFMLFAWQIADGMRFLASKHIIHRDLAARNILIDGQKNAKISDFGLCIVLDENYAITNNSNRSYVSGSGRLPIKWLAIEALTQHEFSTKSDIWSFSMTLFEMYSFGETPFNEIPPRKLADHLKQGNRPAKPILCPDEMYDLMESCWREAPEKRPTFQEILTKLTLLLEAATKEYGYLDLEAVNTEEYTTNVKLGLAKSFNDATTDGPIKKKSRNLYSSNSNASEHRPHYNHKITGISGKISKRKLSFQ